ncbi:hypothetical protein ACM66B_005233 [Microbotryomycetes sp. NB124-2]
MPPSRTDKQPRPSGKFRSSGGQTIKRAAKQARPSKGAPSSQIKAKHAQQQLRAVSDEAGDEDTAADEQLKDDSEAEDDDEEQQSVQQSKPRAKKRKVFVEDKDQMLSLIAGIADEKEQQAKKKVQRARTASKKPRKEQLETRDKKGAVKFESKGKALDKAKAIVAAREKSKREQNKRADAETLQRANEPKTSGASKTERKRVSFA